MDSKHNRAVVDTYSSSSGSDHGGDDDDGVQHLEPLPLLALSQHRCDSVLLQAFNQAVARINVLQQIIDELCDHLYIQNDPNDNDEDPDDPWHGMGMATGTDTDEQGDEDENADEHDTSSATSSSDNDTADDSGTLQGDMPDELVAQTLLELAAFAVTPKNRRQRQLGRGSRPR